jgi:hypothetical protein
MSQIEFVAPVKNMRGELEKGSGIVIRQKKYRAPNGKVLKEGVHESYKIVHPRDYQANPPKGAELANITSFAESKRLSSEIINSERIPDDEFAALSPEQQAHILELRQQLNNFRQRFYAQFKKPDPEAPFEKRPRPGSIRLLRKQYTKLDNFIQAIIRERTRLANE